jgi:hypothetical protein
LCDKHEGRKSVKPNKGKGHLSPEEILLRKILNIPDDEELP